jgi:hypothetical protein
MVVRLFGGMVGLSRGAWDTAVILLPGRGDASKKLRQFPIDRRSS